MKRNARGLTILVSSILIACATTSLHDTKIAAGIRGSRLNRLYSTIEVPVYASESPQATAPGAKKAPTALIPLPDGDGKDTTKRFCGRCHSTNIFASQGYTREKWTSVIDAMTAKGMEASDDEVNEMLDYLALNFPPQPGKSSATPPANPPAPK
jgi:cytochrome c5